MQTQQQTHFRFKCKMQNSKPSNKQIETKFISRFKAQMLIKMLIIIKPDSQILRFETQQNANHHHHIWVQSLLLCRWTPQIWVQTPQIQSFAKKLPAWQERERERERERTREVEKACRFRTQRRPGWSASSSLRKKASPPSGKSLPFQDPPTPRPVVVVFFEQERFTAVLPSSFAVVRRLCRRLVGRHSWKMGRRDGERRRDRGKQRRRDREGNREETKSSFFLLFKLIF